MEQLKGKLEMDKKMTLTMKTHHLLLLSTRLVTGPIGYESGTTNELGMTTRS